MLWRIHHSWHAAEHDKNLSFKLTWWDRALGTYLAQSRDGQIAMTLGLAAFREPEWRRLIVTSKAMGDWRPH